VEKNELEELYVANRYKWVEVASSYVGPNGAEDVVHDVMVWVLEGSEQLPPGQPVNEWIINLIRLRGKGQRREEERYYAEVPRYQHEEDLRLCRQVQDGIDKLTPRQGEAIWRCLSDGETERSVARDWRISQPGVHQCLERGVEQLRSLLEPLGEGRVVRNFRRPRRDR
jgi:DNA-directed RNA polymerase specialized sigma24 family protein